MEENEEGRDGGGGSAAGRQAGMAPRLEVAGALWRGQGSLLGDEKEH